MPLPLPSEVIEGPTEVLGAVLVVGSGVWISRLWQGHFKNSMQDLARPAGAHTRGMQSLHEPQVRTLDTSLPENVLDYVLSYGPLIPQMNKDKRVGTQRLVQARSLF